MRKLLCCAALAAVLAGCTAGPVPPPATTTATPVPTTSAPATSNGQVFGPGCSRLPQGDVPGSLATMARQPVATALGANPPLSQLGSIIGAAGLAATLDQQQSVTVFAPDDAAFEEVRVALGPERYAAMLADSHAVTNVLALHVVGTRYDAAGLQSAKTVHSLTGAELTIGGTAQAPTVTDPQGTTAKVLCGNIPTANATVFVIDKVLMPKV
ncbi:fasciclin domain-containing protein [Pseudonocardia sp. CA-107938]|uniref:fasciclin domain-containing protein n=1 Tax=Pseudonocardia sp. CA-107938 TaxID=3240021 RepID=UPI003D8A5FB6